MFSMFRGHTVICLTALLTLSSNQDLLLKSTLEIYEQMRARKFKSSDYLVIAAFLIAGHSHPTQYSTAVERAKAFYDRMKLTRRFHTNSDDYIFATLLALSESEIEQAGSLMDRLYDQLKPELPFKGGNNIQTLSQVLAIGQGDPAVVVPRVLALRDHCKVQNLRLDKGYTLPSLGILALLSAPTDEIMTDVAETYQYLRTEKGLGKWSISSSELLLFCSSFVACKHIKEGQHDKLLLATTSNEMKSIIISQQIALTIAIVSAAVAASAGAVAASSSH